MKLSHRKGNSDPKKCFHPYATLHRDIDCKYYIDGLCSYTAKDGCGYIYEELKKGVAK